jgi:copper transport protein
VCCSLISTRICGSRPPRWAAWAVPMLALAVALGAWLMTPSPAQGHAAFERSEPTPNAVLPEAPSEIVMWFTEPLEYSFSGATLYNQRGDAVEDVSVGPGPNDYSLQIDVPQPLERGTYSVSWHNLSTADGHTQQGYFAFTIGTESDVASVTAPEDSTSGPPLWLRSLSRWLALISLAPIIAVAPVWLLVLYPAIRERAGTLRAASERLVLILSIALGLALVGNVLALVVQAATLTGGTLVERIGDTLADTRYGRLWLARIGLLLLTALIILLVDWMRPRRNRAVLAAAVIVPLLLPLPISLNAHASALTAGRTTAIVFDWVHIVTASVWFGGLLLVAGTLLRLRIPAEEGGRAPLLARAMPRFSAVALVCWGLLILTGIYAAWLHVGGIEALRETAYGRSLTVKLLGIAVVLALALANLLFVTRKLSQASDDPAAGGNWARRLRVAVSAEIVLALLIFFMVGRMTSQQPARDAIASVAPEVTIDLMLDERPATLNVSPGTAGPNTYILTIDGDTLPNDTEALLRVDRQGDEIGLNEIDLERQAGNVFSVHGIEMGMTGSWDIETIVRQIGGFSWSATAQVEVGESDAAARQASWRFSTHSIAGLLLVGIGLAGIVIAWRAGPSRLRTELAGLGVIALLLGLGIMATDRVEPATAAPRSRTINPIAATEDSIVAGAAIYESYCLSCHGASGLGDGPGGEGMRPPPVDFTRGHALVHTDVEWFMMIENGKPNTEMPAFGDELSDEEIWHVINYVQTQFQGHSTFAE